LLRGFLEKALSAVICIVGLERREEAGVRKRRKKTTNMKSRQPFVEEELFMAGRDGSKETMDESDEEDGLWKRERERERERERRAMGDGEIVIVGRFLMRSKRHMKEYNCRENWGQQRHWVVGNHHR
jgi:hypothetical protein